MPDIAKLGLIVDATGAQREIKLTTEQLRALANGGKEAQAALRGVAAPQVVQQMQTQTAVVGRATVQWSHMRREFTSLAVAAGALPGELGRVAAGLAPFAIGGGATVGVLAGIAAISYAWKSLTADAEAARLANERVAKSLREMEGKLGTAARRIRIASLEGQEADLKSRVDQGVRGFGAGDTFMERYSGVGANRAYRQAAKDLQDVRDRLAAVRLEEQKWFQEQQGNLKGLPAITITAVAGSKERADALRKEAEEAKRLKEVLDNLYLKLGSPTSGQVNITGKGAIGPLRPNTDAMGTGILATIQRNLKPADLSDSQARTAVQLSREQSSAFREGWREVKSAIVDQLPGRLAMLIAGRTAAGQFGGAVGGAFGTGVGSFLGKKMGEGIGGAIGSAVFPIVGSLAGAWIGSKIGDLFGRPARQSADSLSALAKAAERVTASISNIPTGFRLARYVYGADAGRATGAGASRNYGGTAVTFTGNITVVASNPNEFMRQIGAMAENTLSRGGVSSFQYAVARAGA